MKKTILKKCKILLGIGLLFLFMGVDTLSANSELRFYSEEEYETIYTLKVDSDLLSSKGYTIDSITEEFDRFEGFDTICHENGNEIEIAIYDYSMKLFDSFDDSYYDINSWKETLTIHINKEEFINHLLSLFDMFTLEELQDTNGRLILDITLPGEIYEANDNIDNIYSYSASYDLLSLEEPYIEIKGSSVAYHTSYDENTNSLDEDSFANILESKEFVIFSIIAIVVFISIIIATLQVRNMKKRNSKRYHKNYTSEYNTNNRYETKNMERQNMTRQSMDRQFMTRQKTTSTVKKKTIFSQLTSTINEIKAQTNSPLSLMDKSRTTTTQNNNHPYSPSNTKKEEVVVKKDMNSISTPNKPKTEDGTHKEFSTYENTTLSNSDTTAYKTQRSTTSIFKLNSNMAQEAPPAKEAEPAIEALPAKAIDEE